MLTKNELEGIEKRLKPILDEQKRAEKLRSKVPNAVLYVALLGLEIGSESFDIIEDFIRIRIVTNPPGIVSICSAADPTLTDYLGVTRYSKAISAEIAAGNLDFQDHNDTNFLLGLAWHAAALLKLRTTQTLFCPCVTTTSWDTVASVSDQSVKFLLLDDVPRMLQVTSSTKKIGKADLIWVRDNFDKALELRDSGNSRRFGLAFNISYTWNYTIDPRVAIANIWCGLDALFGVQTDRPVTKKLIKRIASWLPGVTEDQIGDLYRKRCDAVHGRWMEGKDIQKVIDDSFTVLKSCLIRCIENKQKTLPDW